MLVQHFMTADDLGIAADVRDALITVLGMLEREEFLHEQFGGNFTMVGWDIEPDCGTPTCMGGWASRFLRRDVLDEPSNANLDDLFFVRSMKNACALWWERITVPQAAAALRNYLTLGDARWPEVLAS